MTVKVPKRRITFDIEGKLYEATELSAHYLMEATVNPEYDTIDNAIEDAMGALGEDDYKRFGIDTKEAIYREIVKFTFSNRPTSKDIKAIAEDTGMSVEEVSALSTDAQVQLKSIIDARTKTEDGKKKKSSGE